MYMCGKRGPLKECNVNPVGAESGPNDHSQVGQENENMRRTTHPSFPPMVYKSSSDSGGANVGSRKDGASMEERQSWKFKMSLETGEL